MLSKLTLSSFHNLENGAIWDNLVLPEGYNKDIVVNEILRQSAEFSLIYPDYDFMKYQIGIWSQKFYHNFDRWLKAYNFDYEALYNVDVKTTTTDAAKDTDNELKKFSRNVGGNSVTQSQGKNATTTSSDANQFKAAYDASTLQPIGRNSDTTSDSTSTSLSTSEGHSESESSSESNSHSWEHSQTLVEVKQGNYGTTMSQELLAAEYNIWRNNIYVMIAELFVSEFCICIYQ